ncbi:SusC/RagA family TonB-linked outer membrane protein [Terrimonas pollutisoli]|uniref:SusC/RagA family TonB-linked outer membrane protein n=1 Tax=Terrimonas pollutisoli TaxID=3034147 RepID=UPI0023ED92AE|nr:TonB-dependent receptor [Terrimonas sp. H1YJ31]
MKVLFRENLKQTCPPKNRLFERAITWLLCFLLFAFVSTPASAQGNISVKGRVTNENGQAVPGASVTVKGSSLGTTADGNGDFSINAPANATLIISAINYLEQEIKISNRQTVNIGLTSLAKTETEVIVVGYGTQKKIDVTGSVTRVNLEAMGNAPNTNIGQFLQGTVPGLNVGLSTFAGGTPPISIRGRVTINGSQSVLIIIDGVQYTGSLSSINPDDIASIDVLKDASSTAVYGAQAANGVILITSRKGKYNQKPRIAFSTAYTTQNPTVDLRPLNREEYLEQFKDAFYTQAFMGPDYTQPNPAFNVAAVMDPTMVNATRTEVLPNDFDWWDAGVNTGSIFENTLSFSGGGDKVTYLLSGGLVDQKGYIINDKFKRKSIRANLEVRPVNWWKVGLVSSGSFVNQDGAEPSLGNLSIASPVLVPFDSAGNIIPFPTNTVVPNPFNTYYVDDYDRHQYYFANIYSDLDIPFIKGLNYRMNFGNNYRTDQHYYASKFDGGLQGRAYKENQTYYDYTFDNILTYTKNFGRHDITATALYGAIERKYSRTFAEGVGFSRLNLSYNDLSSATTKNITTNANTEALNYQMGRVNYKYNDKYLLTATVRRDGYSGFAENFKSAVFPTVALGWIISSEKFMANVNAVNFLKLRAGYGAIGNQTQRYQSLSRVGTNSSYVFGDGGGTAFGQQVNSLENPNLKWEKTEGVNFGLDFTLLKNRLTGTLDYYNNNTKDLLFDVSIPSVTGFLLIASNVGKINNQGFEAGLTYKIIDKKDFTWSSTFNFWTNTNKIKKLTGVDANGDGIEDDLVSTGLFIGKSIQTIFNYKVEGIYQLNDTRLPGFPVGSNRIVDLDKNNDITAADRMFLGRQEPAYRMSWYNTFSYKNFSLSFFFNSIQGGKDGYLGDNTREYFREDNSVRNNELNAVDFWSPRNPGGKYPRNISGGRTKVAGNNYESRSFVRLQDVSLSYSLSPKILEKIKAQAINIYVSGKNLATWTDWEGWDPESLVPVFRDGRTIDVPDGLLLDGRPALRAITVGAHITF